MRLRWRTCWLLLLFLCGTGCNPFSAAEYNRLRGDPYALDSTDRTIEPDGGVECQKDALILYRGTEFKLDPPASIAAPFEARLIRFEQKVGEIAERIYGRSPSHMLHAGTYACRSVGHRPTRFSEHALGNAIDVTGFRFKALPKKTSAAERTSESKLPSKLRAEFVITVSRHFKAKDEASEVDRIHQRFFEELAGALREGQLFRGVIGPPDPAHKTHLHLDMSPWRHIRI